MVKEDGSKEEDPKEMSDTERPKVYAMGIPHEVSESAVTNFFSSYGKVTDVVFKTSGDGRVLKGLAYIYFESQESVDKLLEKKTVTIEDKKVHVKKALEEISQEGEKPELEIPSQALKCIVCKHNKFSSVTSYLNHRKGRHHQAVLKIYRSKSASVRQLLKAEATLAVERQYNAAWMTKHPNFNHFCEICKCQIYCDPDKHNNSNAHKLLKNYDVQKCCDIEFTERKKYENHLLSLSHLKKAYAKEQLNKTNGDDSYGITMKKAIDVFKQCESDLKELKETYGELDLNDEIPPYDPQKPIGLNFIVKKINYHCLCCDQKFFANKKIVEPHCCSYQHFCNMQDYTLKIEKAQATKWRKEDQESAKEDAKKEGEAGKRKNEEPYKPNKKKAAAEGKGTNDKEDVASEEAKSEDAQGDENAAEESEEEQQDADDMDTLEKSGFNEDEEEYGQGDDLNEAMEAEEEPIEDQDFEEPADDQEPEELLEDQDDEEQEDEEIKESQDDDIEEIKESQDDDIEEISVVKAKQIEVVDINDDVSEVETPAKEEQESQVQPKPQKAIRGRRGRGRGRGLRK